MLDNKSTKKQMTNQTNYYKEMATSKLKEWDNNYMNVIREYLYPNINEKKKEKKKKRKN